MKRKPVLQLTFIVKIIITYISQYLNFMISKSELLHKKVANGEYLN